MSRQSSPRWLAWRKCWRSFFQSVIWTEGAAMPRSTCQTELACRGTWNFRLQSGTAHQRSKHQSLSAIVLQDFPPHHGMQRMYAHNLHPFQQPFSWMWRGKVAQETTLRQTWLGSCFPWRRGGFPMWKEFLGKSSWILRYYHRFEKLLSRCTPATQAKNKTPRGEFAAKQSTNHAVVSTRRERSREWRRTFHLGNLCFEL